MTISYRYKSVYRIKNEASKNVIFSLLKEIGPYEYYRQLELLNLVENKPILLREFYLESKLDGIHLCYRYPMLSCSIMTVNGYDNVPLSGWDLEENHESFQNPSSSNQ
nr:hypothetical protein [uncultured Allomuricauda sp.]